MNEVILIGKVVNVPKLKMENGHKTCTFNIEVERTQTLPTEKSIGINKKYYEFPRIFAFDEVAETLLKNIKKSELVKITGWVHVRLSNHGHMNSYHTEIIADKIDFIGKGGDI